MELDNVLSDLESIGFCTQALVIPACAVDARHRRDRIWIVAHAAHGGIRRRGAQRESRQPSCSREDVADAYGQPTGHGDDDVRTIQRTGSEGGESGSTIRPRKRRTVKPGLDRMVNGISARMDNHFDEEPADIPRTGKGIQNRVARLKALGNSIVPQVAYEIFKAMVEANK